MWTGGNPSFEPDADARSRLAVGAECPGIRFCSSALVGPRFYPLLGDFMISAYHSDQQSFEVDLGSLRLCRVALPLLTKIRSFVSAIACSLPDRNALGLTIRTSRKGCQRLTKKGSNTLGSNEPAAGDPISDGPCRSHCTTSARYAMTIWDEAADAEHDSPTRSARRSGGQYEG